jgi:hypothetical protein
MRSSGVLACGGDGQPLDERGLARSRLAAQQDAVVVGQRLVGGPGPLTEPLVLEHEVLVRVNG